MPSSSFKALALIAAAGAPVALAKQVSAGAITVPMVRGSNQTAYYSEVQVGTPPQKNYLKVESAVRATLS